MSDRRETPANGRVAHVSLKGHIAADQYVEGTLQHIWGEPFLYDAPFGKRDRQLLHGEAFLELEAHEGWSFGQSQKDGYCGYLKTDHLADLPAPTHRVAVRQTHLYPEPDLKSPASVCVSLNARLSVNGVNGSWAEVATPSGSAFVPYVHLKPVNETEPDLISTAELLLGTPYVWGGNSSLGIDCSGLVSAACQAAGIDCPGDSDQQESALGEPLVAGAALQRNDLVFWKGHVAIAVGDGRILHANAGAMAVALEDFEAACNRIEAAGDGPFTSRRRL